MKINGTVASPAVHSTHEIRLHVPATLCSVTTTLDFPEQLCISGGLACKKHHPEFVHFVICTDSFLDFGAL